MVDLKRDIKEHYVHFVPPARANPFFFQDKKLILVESVEQLAETALEKSTYSMGFDTETTGLNYLRDRICGFSYGISKTTAYYAPIRHKFYNNNLDPKTALDIIYEALVKANHVFMFNAPFDMTMMMLEGYDMRRIKPWDVQLAVFMADTNAKYPALKPSAKHFMGVDMQTYEEVSGGANFHFLNPKEALFYAASDALLTTHLALKTAGFAQEGKAAWHLDVKIIVPFTYCVLQRTLIDFEGLFEQEKIIKDLQTALGEEIFDTVGYRFNINSPEQLSEALLDLQIMTGEYTSKGFQKTGKKYLMKTKNPVANKIILYKEFSKAITSYINPLKDECLSQNSRIAFNYHLTGAPTGRLSAGKSGKNRYFSSVNIQAITKPKIIKYYTERASIYKGPGTEIMGWKFSQDKISNKEIEGYSGVPNLRKLFLPEKGHYWVSIDYAGQELRIPANLSKEKVWVDAFTAGRDVHAETGIKLWKDKYTKDRRKKVKEVNFGIIYGMSEKSLAERLGISLEEAAQFMEEYKAALPDLFKWMDAHKTLARRMGTVYTYMGRPRRVKFYFQSKRPGTRGFGYRTAVNTVIQGMGADILKFALIMVWDNVLNVERYKDDVLFRSTVHDEINFSVLIERIYEMLDVLKKLMTLKIPGWEVPMEVGVSVGTSWGEMFEFEKVGDEWIPKYTAKEDLQTMTQEGVTDDLGVFF